MSFAWHSEEDTQQQAAGFRDTFVVTSPYIFPRNLGS